MCRWAQQEGVECGEVEEEEWREGGTYTLGRCWPSLYSSSSLLLMRGEEWREGEEGEKGDLVLLTGDYPSGGEEYHPTAYHPYTLATVGSVV